jgi:transcriptional regulator
VTAKTPDQPRSYPPPPFHETRHEILADFVRRNPFGFLVTAADGLHACGVPFVLRESGDGLRLDAHLARSNPQTCAEGAPALVLFQGPHAYVRPRWYETWKRDGKAVPTWDYICVQARGRLSVVDDDPAWLRGHLEALSAQQEAAFADPWTPADPPDGYVDRLARGIVGVRLEGVTLEGVWKAHQNHPAENRQAVVAALDAEGRDDTRAIARAIEALSLGR